MDREALPARGDRASHAASWGLCAALLLAVAWRPVPAQESATIEVIERQRIADVTAHSARPLLVGATHELVLTLVLVEETGWNRDEILTATLAAAALFGQCGVRLDAVETLIVAAPARYRDFHTPRSRELARSLQPPRPTVYFVADTRQRPAFDAEAVGRGNSRTRPELADSVWVTRATRDLPLALAHELAHVLMNSGDHPDLPGNLMRDETAAQNTRLTGVQCERLRDTGTRHGLLRRIDG